MPLSTAHSSLCYHSPCLTISLSFFHETVLNPYCSRCILILSTPAPVLQPTTLISLPANGLLLAERNTLEKDGGGALYPTYPHRSIERYTGRLISWGLRGQRKKSRPLQEAGHSQPLCDSAPGHSLQVQAGSWDTVLGLWLLGVPMAELALTPIGSLAPETTSSKARAFRPQPICLCLS